MNYTPRLENAIRTAGKLHATHFRKGRHPMPYLTHLFSVAALVATHSEDEDIVIAALLHDSIEDTEYTFDELEQAFGARVRALVAGVTEPQTEGERHLTWDERKRAYIDGLRQAPLESLMIAAADKTHNFESAIEEYRHEPGRFWHDFPGDPDSRRTYYETVVALIEERLEHELSKNLREAFDRYVNFLNESYRS